MSLFSDRITVAMFVLDIWIVVCEGAELSIEVEPPHANTSFCLSNNSIKITCIGFAVPVVSEWFVNGTKVAEDIFRESNTYPRNPDRILDPSIIVNITKATRVSVTAINITSIISGNFTTLSSSMIEWGSDVIRSDPILVEASKLGAINVTSVTQKYGENLMIAKIAAVWERLVSTQCPMLFITYEIAVRNSFNDTIISVPTNCTDQAMDRCRYEIDVPEPFYEVYFLEITASSGDQGTASFHRTEAIAGRVNSTSNSSDFDVIASRCLESITCVSCISRRCEVRIGSSLSSAMSADTSVSGFINSSILTSFLSLDRRDTIHYVAKFEVTEMIVIEVKGEFSNIEVAVKLNDWNAALIIIGILLSVVSIFLLIIVVLVALLTSYMKTIIRFRVIVFSSVVTVTIDVILWIVTTAVVAPREDTCDSNWQSLRDALIVADLIISVVCTVVSVSIVILFYSFCQETNTSNSTKNKKSGWLIQAGIDVKNIKFDETGRSDAETNITQYHRGLEESAKNAQLRTREALTMAIKEEKLKEEHLYHTTKFTSDSPSTHAPTMPMSGPPSEYSQLNEGKKNNDYQRLREFKQKSHVPRPIPVQNSKEVYSQLNPDTAVHESGNKITTSAANSKSPKTGQRTASQSPTVSQTPNTISNRIILTNN